MNLTEDDPAVGTLALAERGITFVIADLPQMCFFKAADAGRSRDVVFLNAGATDDRLRRGLSRKRDPYRTDAVYAGRWTGSLSSLGKWRRWLLVIGSHVEDKRYAEALRRAAGRFGARAVVDATLHKVQKYLLVGQRVWQLAFTPDEKYLLPPMVCDVSVIDVTS